MHVMKIKLLNTLTLLLILSLVSLSTTVSAQGNYQHSITALSNDIQKPLGIVTAKDETIYFSSSETHNIYKHLSVSVDHFAGFDVLDNEGHPMYGLYDGDIETALFSAPAGMDVDAEGNLYIADSENHAIRKITTDGEVKTVAGDGVLGNQDGKGSKARFDSPMDVAVAEDGSLYVTDTLNHVIRKIDTDGEVTTLTKTPDRLVEVSTEHGVDGGDYQDGKIDESMFNEPASIVIDHNGNLFVSDSGNHVIRYIDFEKDKVTTVAGTADASAYDDKTLYLKGGFSDGNLNEAIFKTPKGITLTESGNLVVADSGNSHIRYINLAEQIVETLTNDGDLFYPSDIAIANNGDLIVTDTRSHQVKRIMFGDLPNGFGEYERDEKLYADDGDIASYAKEAVYQAQRLGIMIGTSDNRFSPKQELTRSQFAKVIVESLNLKLVSGEDKFADVADNEWYTAYIHTAAAHGIVNGYGDGNFGPNDAVSRQEMALMIGRTKNWDEKVNGHIYNDQPDIWEEALPAVVALRERGIMIGDENENFNPESPVTREMAAVVITRLIDKP